MLDATFALSFQARLVQDQNLQTNLYHYLMLSVRIYYPHLFLDRQRTIRRGAHRGVWEYNIVYMSSTVAFYKVNRVSKERDGRSNGDSKLRSSSDIRLSDQIVSFRLYQYPWRLWMGRKGHGIVAESRRVWRDDFDRTLFVDAGRDAIPGNVEMNL